MSSWYQPQGVELPRPSMQRAPSVPDEPVLSFDSELPTSIEVSPGSLISDQGSLRGVALNAQQTKTLPRTLAGVQLEENNDDGNKQRPRLQVKPSVVPVALSEVSSTPHPAPSVSMLETLLGGLQLEENKPESPVTEIQPAPFQFTSFAPSNAIPASNRTSLLFSHFKDQAPAYGQPYGTAVATSPIIHQPSFPHSTGHAPLSSMGHYMSSSLNTNEQGQYPPLKFDEDWEFQLLSPGAEITSLASDWPLDQGQAHAAVDKGQAHTAPIGIPSTNKSHWRGASFSSASTRAHPYPSSSDGGAGDGIYSPGTSFMDTFAKQFAPHQQQAALNILNYSQTHPKTAIPASLITAELAEVQEGRGWCLLGNCGVERAKQKLNPDYDIQKDFARKRLDHLYDHIRDKHFNCRPFRCSIPPCAQTFSREHDLKRHEKTHMAVSLPCEVCGKQYTRDDNLKRHVQLKHWSLPQTSRRPSGIYTL